MADISIARLSAVLPATELVPVLQNEIERLRLTDREREALRTVIGGFGMWVAQNGLADDESLRLAVVALRSLLERHCPTPENPPPQDNAPETHSNQSEVSVQDSDT